ncbi:type II secretion system protein GspG [Lysobacteraceae bacterium NML07-0707]|nr:type II secretion system protein GspG [Xanthomonadaceae bacterium NML07-0707]
MAQIQLSCSACAYTSAVSRSNDGLIVRKAPFSLARRQSGFTLLEMIVVLVIIGLIMGLVGPRLFGQADKAKVQTAETQVKMLRGALQTMRLDIGRVPTAEEGLAILNTAPNDPRIAQRWRGPYLDEALPEDPWGNPYQYSPAASGSSPFSLYSLGADGQPGGEGYDADIGYVPDRQ